MAGSLSDSSFTHYERMPPHPGQAPGPCFQFGRRRVLQADPKNLVRTPKETPSC